MDAISWLRQFRIGGFAIADFSATLLAAFLLAPLLSGAFKKIGIIIPRKNWLFLSVPVSVAVHLTIGRITPLTADFIDPSGHFLTKILVAVLLGLGLENIERAAPRK